MWNEDTSGVCSRNLELKNEGGAFWDTANQAKHRRKYEKHFQLLITQYKGSCVEPVSKGINTNLTISDFFVYDVFDIDAQKYVSPHVAHSIAKTLWARVCSYYQDTG